MNLIMNKYILSEVPKSGEKNAGFKARKDIIEILCKHGYNLHILYYSTTAGFSVSDVFRSITSTIKLAFKLKKDDIVFIQYPVNRFTLNIIYKILNMRKINIVSLIHDIDFLRNIQLGKKGVEGMKKQEISLLRKSKYIICHNKIMIAELKKYLPEKKMIPLELFDYLHQGQNAHISEDVCRVIVAGNLTYKKARYIYKLNDMDRRFQLCLYGTGLKEDIKLKNTEYKGSFAPEQLIDNLEGTYGLVWDGSEIDRCAGDYGKYLRYNNPHKLSLYIAAGIPVIVWKEAAIAKFVEKNKIGFSVNSLEELDHVIKEKSDLYSKYLVNIRLLNVKVRSGIFLSEAISKVENDIIMSNL